jgi:general L-amino acid transport system substrate-binding protein
LIRSIACLLLAFAAPAWAADPTPSATLAAVKARQKLVCATVTETNDWNKSDLHGDLSRLGGEVCRAMAVATLGRADAVEIVPAPAEDEALGALRDGRVDVVVGVTPSASVGLRFGLVYGPPVFWDTQTFMVHKALGVANGAGLAGKTVCFINSTDNAGVVLTAFKEQGIQILNFPFEEEGEMDAALVGGHCRAVSAYASKLAQVRTQFHKLVHDFVLLPDRLAMSPAVIATRQGDAAWNAIAAATVDTLVQAQMLGVTQANVARKRGSEDPVVQHLLGVDWSAGLAMGLSGDSGARVIAALGNYGEIYRRTVGEDSAMGLALGPNADCLHGGVMCAVPVR